jgi:hypothetical protein
LCWSTYLGGDGFDLIAEGDGIAVGEEYVYYIANSNGAEFPIVEQVGAFNQTSAQGLGDGVIICLSRADLSVVWTSYLGGSEFDQLQAIGLDSWGNVYITGHSLSSDYPLVTLTNAYNQANAGGGPNPFTGDAVLTTFTHPNHGCTWSTFIGGSSDLSPLGNDAAYAIKVRGAAQVFVGGVTYSTLPPYPTYNPGNGAFFSALQASGGMALSCFDIGTVPIEVAELASLDLNGLLLYPNPVDDCITVQIGSTIQGPAEILDMSGRFVASHPIVRTKVVQSFSLSGVSRGAYLLRVISGSGVPIQVPFIKQ